MILHPENLRQVTALLRKGHKVFYVNVWMQKSGSRTRFYGDAHASRGEADRATLRKPNSYCCPYRLRICVRGGQP